MTSRPQVALATQAGMRPDPDDVALAAALRGRGIGAELLAWDDPAAPWSAMDTIVVRSTWDYTTRRDEFVAWAARAGEVAALWNPADVVTWNTHKGYLADLEERGAPTVPTVWLHQGQRVELGALLAAQGWSQAVAKPAVGASGTGVLRIEPDTVPLAQHHLDALLARGDALVQPLLDAVASAGETSLVFVDGVCTHAVRKVPAAGQILTQPERGARLDRIEPAAEVVELASWVIDLVGRELLYARVDLVPDADGVPQLVELELVEPSLYLAHAPGVVDRLADAIARRVHPPPPTVTNSG